MPAASGITVIICTHSPRRDYLERTLRSLAEQTIGPAAFDLLLVDNASSKPVSSWCDLGWHPSARIVVEPELGLAFARIRGIDETRSNLIVWVDDDNLLAPDYLEQVTALARDWPMLGLWGCGHITPEWETPPPPELAPFLRYLAVGRAERDSWSNHPFDHLATPIGAGLCVRLPVAQSYAAAVRNDPVRRSLGRKGIELGGCEDIDLGLTAVNSGHGTGVFVRLRLTHLMPAGRIREEYLLRLVEGHSCSSLLLHHVHDNAAPVPRGLLAAIRRWRLHRSLGPVQRRIDDARRRGESRALLVIARLSPPSS
ncbi:MAG: glycosyltransferase [Opitutaceae bacterium]|jgi:hypothetical protein